MRHQFIVHTWPLIFLFSFLSLSSSSSSHFYLSTYLGVALPCNFHCLSHCASPFIIHCTLYFHFKCKLLHSDVISYLIVSPCSLSLARMCESLSLDLQHLLTHSLTYSMCRVKSPLFFILLSCRSSKLLNNLLEAMINDSFDKLIAILRPRPSLGPWFIWL